MYLRVDALDSIRSDLKRERQMEGDQRRKRQRGRADASSAKAAASRSHSYQTHHVLEHHHSKPESHSITNALGGDVTPDPVPVRLEPSPPSVSFLFSSQQRDILDLRLDGGDLLENVRMVGR